MSGVQQACWNDAKCCFLLLNILRAFRENLIVISIILLILLDEDEIATALLYL